ncbi:MAG: nickel pincer cofactor biosynthesis protein LarC [Thermodesulfobacteria bacterium]|nr:nickel pincer cofactor biosynthesis protein LarC [Thermodesulfobacteriota bacterium]
MKVGYLDCFSGISGDMLLGAFIDAGWNKDELLGLPSLLGLNATVEIKRESRNGISAVRVEIIPGDDQPHRRLDDILKILTDARLPEGVKGKAKGAFERLAEAEAKVHGCPIRDVHFHETGAVDAIIDIVGAFMAKESLGLKRLVCSPLPLSRGFVKCQHGTLPLPAPAVLELLKGVETHFVHEEDELVTPTGALLARELANDWGLPPAMKIDATGYGAGSRNLASRPNLLRLIVGEVEGGKDGLFGQVVELKTVIDDMNPEQVGFLMERLFSSGAVDAWLTPVFMKKNRPGVELTVLSQEEDLESLSHVLFSNSTTTGIRFGKTDRMVLERYPVKVKTKWGKLRAKAIVRPQGKVEIVPEYEECRAIAKEHGLPIGEVYRAVICSGDTWQPEEEGEE